MSQRGCERDCRSVAVALPTDDTDETFNYPSQSFAPENPWFSIYRHPIAVGTAVAE
jgi:hypothetical protein